MAYLWGEGQEIGGPSGASTGGAVLEISISLSIIAYI